MQHFYSVFSKVMLLLMLARSLAAEGAWKGGRDGGSTTGKEAGRRIINAKRRGKHAHAHWIKPSFAFHENSKWGSMQTSMNLRQMLANSRITGSMTSELTLKVWSVYVGDPVAAGTTVGPFGTIRKLHVARDSPMLLTLYVATARLKGFHLEGCKVRIVP